MSFSESDSPNGVSAVTACLGTSHREHTEQRYDTLPLEEVSVDVLKEYEVLWWHRSEAIDQPTEHVLSAVRDELVEFVEDGGGLLLTHGAVEAASLLGIETRTPDCISHLTGETTGYLVHRAFQDHPIFDGFDELRPPTVPTSDAVSVHYESGHPNEADVLASSRIDGCDHPERRSILRWGVGDGCVVGIGHGVADVETDVQTRLLTNVQQYLRGPAADPETLGRPKGRREFEALREAVPDPNHRPAYHFTAPANWLNDPNGLVQWNGQYHLFYQYNPAGPFHGTMHWGHAVSDDLIHWEDEPLALTPDPSGPDSDGCFSGCFVDDEGTPTVLYTGTAGDAQLPCLARAEDDTLRNWTKADDNPLLDGGPDEVDVFGSINWNEEFRDHCVWRHDGSWYQLIGSGIEGEGGTAFLYRSEDLLEWEYCRPILRGDWRKTGPIWECPELLQFDNGDLLHVSDYDDVWYLTGAYDNTAGQFDRADSGLLDHGVFYAPQSFEDDTGRTVMFGWLKEDRDQEAQWDAGWSGAISLPREVSLTKDGEPRITPADELRQLRDTHHDFSDLTVEPGATDLLDGIESDTLELKVTFDAADAGEYGVVLRSTPDGEERTVIRCKSWKRELEVDRSQSSRNDTASATAESMPVMLDDGELTVHVFLDRSVLEVFVNDAQTLSTRIYPTREDSLGIGLYAADRDVTVSSLDIWELSR